MGFVGAVLPKPREDVAIGAAGDRQRLLITRGAGELDEAIDGEPGAIETGRPLEERRTGLIQAEKPIAVGVASAVLDEVEDVGRGIDVFAFALDAVVEGGKGPDRA